MTESKHKSGFVNIVGNPNVGKSTLMNLLVGERISIATYGGIDDDTKTRDRTYDEVTRHEEIIDGGCAEYHTYGHHEELDPELAGEQRLSELGQDRLTIAKNLMHGVCIILGLEVVRYDAWSG